MANKITPPPFICLPPTKEYFPNGRTNYIYMYENKYMYYSTALDGSYCYILLSTVAGSRKNRRTSVVPSQNRVCTGEITFIAQNACDIVPEGFEVDFQLDPFGGLFNSVVSGCDLLPHERASFLCSDSTAVIRTKLLAALQPEFVGKVDFTVTKSTLGTGFDNFVTSIIILPDGKMIIGGAFTSYNGTPSNRLIILNPDFSVFLTADGTGFNNTVNGLALLPTGELVVAGNFTSYNGLTSRGVIILDPETLSSATSVRPSGFGFDGAVNAVTILNGDIVIGGGFDNYNGTSSEGIIILDTNLDIVTTAEGTGFNANVTSLAIVNGNIVAGGTFTDYNGATSRAIIILEPTLSSATSIRPSGFGFNTSVFALTIDSNNNIVAGGGFSTYNGTASQGIIILEPSALGIVSTALGAGFGGAGVLGLALEDDGDLVVGGTFTTYNGESSEGIIILNSDLTRDTLADGTGFGAFPNTIAVAIQPDGKIVAGGFFFNYNGVTASHIIRLNEDLTIDVASNETYTITITFTDSTTNPAPTSLIGTVLENCVIIENETDMDLVCVIS